MKSLRFSAVLAFSLLPTLLFGQIADSNPLSLASEQPANENVAA